MAQPPKATILNHFAELDDPRVARTRHHKLVDILAVAICGADSWVHIELFGKGELAWFQSFLELPQGIPPHDTCGDVFARLDPVQLQDCFISWTQAIAELSPGEVVAIDGKTARRSHARAGKQGAIPIRSLTNRVPPVPPGRARPWAKACPVPRHGVKTDEITAIPQLLEMLDLNGCIVTIDAMGCQREIAQQITQGGAEYVLAVKENQGQLHEGIRLNLAERLLRPGQTLKLVRYLTAPVLPRPNGRGQHERQRTYLEALATLPDLHIHQGYFLTKSYLCPFCGSIQETFEEKTTDVNIAVELLGDAQDDTFDTAIIISGDSDLSGPVNAIRQRYSDKRIVVAFPPNHVSKQLRQSANASFIIGRRMFSASLFQEQVPTPGGYVTNKPPEWT